MIAVALLVALGTTAQAQIVSSQSQQVVVTQEVKPEKPKKPKKPWVHQWYVKGGIALDKSEEYEKDTKFGYELLVGLKNPIGKQGAYWGVETGGMSTTYEDYYSHHGPVVSTIAAVANPYCGWNFDISNQTSIAPYCGPYLSYAFDGHSDRGALLGVCIGTNVWFSKNIGFGVSYHRDLVGNDYSDKTSKIGLNIIYAF